MTADFGTDDNTPTLVGDESSCWKCLVVKATRLAAPAPGSSHEALRYSTCVCSSTGDWAVCAPRLVVRLGPFDLYIGPERRTSLPPLRSIGPERRKGPPPFPPRKDDE